MSREGPSIHRNVRALNPIFIAFGVTLLTSVLCIVATLMNWFLSPRPLFTSAMLLMPVAIAGLPLLFQSRSRVMVLAAYVATLLLFVWVAVTGFSAGVFYLPATAVMAIAAVRLAIKTPVTENRGPENPPLFVIPPR